MESTNKAPTSKALTDKTRTNKAQSPVQAYFSQERLAEEEELVRQAIRGDAIALTKLYEYYVELIYRYLYSKVSDPFEAESLTSDTFTRALESLQQGRYTWQNKPFGAWLYGIAKLRLREWTRGRQPSVSLDDLSVSDEPGSGHMDPLDSLLQREEYTALWQLVKALPQIEQRVLILRHVYKMPYAEMAKHLNRSEGACKQFHYRVLRKLKLMAQEVDLWAEVTKTAEIPRDS